jgi:sortase (surface protein transpeptidase)
MKRPFIGLAVVVALATACGHSSQPTKVHAKAAFLASLASTAPARLRIPRLAINAPVERVGVDANNKMGVPRVISDVAWYSGGMPYVPGVPPGQPGDAVIAGHKDSIRGRHGVFWSLRNIHPGDKLLVVLQSGARLRFKVTDSVSVSATSNPGNLGLFATTGAPRLTLITCTGRLNASRTDYLDRLIVDASYEGQG